MKEKIIKHKYEVIYGFLIVLMFGFIYYPFILGKYMYMYMDIGADTYCSYWPSISYAASILQDLKIWDNSLGLGSSTIIQIAYFLVDPFNWVIFLFKPINMDTGIIISLALKYVVLAIFAYKYNRIIGFKEYTCVITSLCIVFSGWFVGWGQHYNYATVYVLFITLLYFMECWIQKGKFGGYVISLAILAMCSVYYCYMSLLFLGCYYLVRRLNQYSVREYKILIKHGIKTIGLCVLGIGIGSIVFLPAVAELLNSPRVSGSLIPNLNIASKSEYWSFLLRCFSNNIMGINVFYGYKNWYESPFIYVGILFFYMIPYFFLNKQISKKKKILTGTFFLIGLLFIQTIAIVFNAFSAITYRWTFVLIPLMSYVIGKGLECIEENKKSIVNIIVFTFLIGINYVNVVSLFKQDTDIDTMVLSTIVCVTAVSTVYFLILQIGRRVRFKYMKVALLGCLTVELIVNGIVSVQCRSMIAKSAKETMGYFDASNSLIDYLNETDDSFYRIAKNYAQIDLNDSMIQKYNSEKYYYSTLSESYLNLQTMFDLRVPASNYFYGFDDKRVLQDINCGKYLFSNNQRNYFNYNLIYESDKKYLYQNLDNEGFGIVYDNYITRSEFDKLDAISKQDVLYKACVIEDTDEEKINISPIDGFKSNDMKEVDYKKEMGDGVLVIRFEENDSPLIIKIANSSDKDYAGTMYTGDETMTYADEGVSVYVKAGENRYYNIDVLDINKLYITADDGIELSIYEKNIEKLSETIENLKSKLTITEQSDERFVGTMYTDSVQMLYIPWIYDKNWKAYVNDKEVMVYRVNGGFCGVLLENGENKVQFVYRNDILTLGGAVTGISLAMFALACILSRKKEKTL